MSDGQAVTAWGQGPTALLMVHVTVWRVAGGVVRFSGRPRPQGVTWSRCLDRGTCVRREIVACSLQDCFPTGRGVCCQAGWVPTGRPQRSESWRGSASGPPPLREDLLPADRASPPALGAKAERHRTCRAVVGRQAQLTFFGFCFYYLSRFRFPAVRRRYRDFSCPLPAPRASPSSTSSQRVRLLHTMNPY